MCCFRLLASGSYHHLIGKDFGKLTKVVWYSVIVQPAPVGQLGGVLELEDEKSVPKPDWNSDLLVFEHINIDSGGKESRDPS